MTFFSSQNIADHLQECFLKRTSMKLKSIFDYYMEEELLRKQFILFHGGKENKFLVHLFV